MFNSLYKCQALHIIIHLSIRLPNSTYYVYNKSLMNSTKQSKLYTKIIK